MDDNSEDLEKDIEIFLQALKNYVSGKTDLVLVEKTFKHLDRFHDFWHFLSDSDIREKDQEYAEMQNQALKKFILALEEKDYVFAKSISFLS